MFRYNRSASVAITAFGALSNFAIAIQVISTWRSLRWEPESEWEASGDSRRVDGIEVVWGLLSCYFASAATVCIIGFLGIVKSKPTLVRFYRDYSIADFSFCTIVTAITTFAVFHTSARTAICEELSRHPELLRDLIEMGLNLENCERWLEHAIFALIAVMFVLIIIRLHFLLAVANLYSQLTRHATIYSRNPSRFRVDSSAHALQRIYLLPPSEDVQLGDNVELVYTPIPISSLSKDVRDSATEAWISRDAPSGETEGHSRPSPGSSYVRCCETDLQRPNKHRRHSHSHSHRQSRSSSATRTGAIRLPILPDEGLLPLPLHGGTSKA